MRAHVSLDLSTFPHVALDSFHTLRIHTVSFHTSSGTIAKPILVLPAVREIQCRQILAMTAATNLKPYGCAW